MVKIHQGLDGYIKGAPSDAIDIQGLLQYIEQLCGGIRELTALIELCERRVGMPMIEDRDQALHLIKGGLNRSSPVRGILRENSQMDERAHHKASIAERGERSFSRDSVENALSQERGPCNGGDFNDVPSAK